MASRATELERKRYDRVAWMYDSMESLMERRFRHWRQLLWAKVTGERVLEVGVGTGKNMPYYPAGVEVLAVDLSEQMLRRASMRAQRLGIAVDLRRMDAEHLDFPDGSFDTVVGTCVFCSVPDPVAGLREAARVCRPGGQVLLLEHVRARNPVIGALMDLANPLTVRLTGANINRPTVENVKKAGLDIKQVTDLNFIFRLMEASADSTGQ